VKKKICIIGGAGFIGHNIAIKLSKVYDVFCIDSLMVNNLISVLGNFDSLKFKQFNKKILEERIDLLENNNIKLVVADARDYHLVSKILEQEKPNIIIHLAAVSHANRSNKDPYNTFDHSLRTLENVLDASRDFVEHFIYFSSSMVYGDFKKKAVTEEDHCNPLGIYGTLKYCGEKIVQAYQQVFNLQYTIVRPSALYGERCISRRVGQIFIENALNKSDIVIEGDGEEELDFTYIEDLVQGVEKIIESPLSKNQTFNITFGSSQSINNLKEILKNNFTNLKIINKKRDKLMPLRGTLSIEKAKKLIGYQPKFDLETGYKIYIDWYKSFWSKNF